jgi:carbon storage regulator
MATVLANRTELQMLVLARKNQESVVIGVSGDLRELIRVTVVEISGGTVKLGFRAGNDLTIHREEVWERVCGEFTESTPELAVERPKYCMTHID